MKFEGKFAKHNINVTFECALCGLEYRYGTSYQVRLTRESFDGAIYICKDCQKQMFRKT